MSKINEAFTSCVKRHTATVALLVVVAVLSLPSRCFAATKDDGNQLLKSCEAALTVADGVVQTLEGSLMAGFCLGFVQGMSQMNDFYVSNTQKGRILFCTPDGVTSGQAARLVVKYLRDHPELLHEDEFVLAVWALNVAFPCANKK